MQGEAGKEKGTLAGVQLTESHLRAAVAQQSDIVDIHNVVGTQAAHIGIGHQQSGVKLQRAAALAAGQRAERGHPRQCRCHPVGTKSGCRGRNVGKKRREAAFREIRIGSVRTSLTKSHPHEISGQTRTVKSARARACTHMLTHRTVLYNAARALAQRSSGRAKAPPEREACWCTHSPSLHCT